MRHKIQPQNPAETILHTNTYVILNFCIINAYRRKPATAKSVRKPCSNRHSCRLVTCRHTNRQVSSPGEISCECVTGDYTQFFLKISEQLPQLASLTNTRKTWQPPLEYMYVYVLASDVTNTIINRQLLLKHVLVHDVTNTANIRQLPSWHWKNYELMTWIVALHERIHAFIWFVMRFENKRLVAGVVYWHKEVQSQCTHRQETYECEQQCQSQYVRILWVS